MQPTRLSSKLSKSCELIAPDLCVRPPSLRTCNSRLSIQVERASCLQVSPANIVYLALGILAPPCLSLAHLMARADSALYTAKKSGRDRVMAA